MSDESATGEAAQPAVRSLEGADALVEHARWIIDTHNARADGLQQRAMGFLGVMGVLLGLVLTGLTIGKAPDHALVRVLAIATVVALVGSSVEFVRCLWLATVSVPPVNGARSAWAGYAGRVITDERVRLLIANDFLGGANDGRDPLTTARTDADTRARRLKRGLCGLVAAFALLAALIVTILLEQAGGDDHGRGTPGGRSTSASSSGSAGPVR